MQSSNHGGKQPIQRNSNPSSTIQHATTASLGNFGQHVSFGLTVAGAASAILTTVFGLFHVQVFLRAYNLPLQTYRAGRLIFAVIHTATNVLGAWFVDSAAMTVARSDLIGLSGVLFAFCFLTPFFRWKHPSEYWLMDGAHFVMTTSLYDTTYSFNAILMNSVVTDNHTMTDEARVNFMASGKVINLIISFLVARVGLFYFDLEDLSQFRSFLTALAIISCFLFIVSQAFVMDSESDIKSHWLRKLLQLQVRSLRKLKSRDELEPLDSDSEDDSSRTQQQQQQQQQQRKQKLHLRRVVVDLWRHNNFRSWVAMEMLLEAQTSFVMSFLKTFVDALLHTPGGIPRYWCDWLLSAIQPLNQITSIVFYIPIQRYGYQRVYLMVFAFNFVVSGALFVFAMTGMYSPKYVTAWIVVYPAITSGIQSAGFHLAMSDMVLEMKRNHALDGRLDEPSLAATYMGANALFCKPAESFLPVLAATFLDSTAFSTTDPSEDTQRLLFYLLVCPPFICSIIQLLVWRNYDLHPERTNEMRMELNSLSREA